MPVGHLCASDCFWICIFCSLCQKYASFLSLNGWFIILDLAKGQFPLGRLPWLPIPPTAGLALHYTSMPLESHNSITSCQYCYASCPPSPIDCLHAGIVPFIFFIFVSCTILDPQSLSQCFLHLQKLAKATWPTRDQTDLHQTFSLQHTPLSLMELRK